MEILRENGIYMNPLTDFGFKKLFFNELNKELLIDFLNEIIQEEGRITDIQYLPTIRLGQKEENRKAIFDIFCKNEKNEFFLVEMQKAKQPYFRDRSLFYASFPIQDQGDRGLWNFDLKAVYVISILDFVLFKEDIEDEKYWIEQVYLMRNRTKTIFSRKLNFVFVELPKFQKTKEELATNADKWLFCIKNLNRLNDRPSQVQGKIFEKFFKAAEIKQLTGLEMEEYKKSILEYQDIKDALEYAKEEARKEGWEEGREEGREKGREEGREEGIEIGLEKIARKCLQKFMPIEDIAELTGLSIKQIQNLK